MPEKEKTLQERAFVKLENREELTLTEQQLVVMHMKMSQLLLEGLKEMGIDFENPRVPLGDERVPLLELVPLYIYFTEQYAEVLEEQDFSIPPELPQPEPSDNPTVPRLQMPPRFGSGEIPQRETPQLPRPFQDEEE